MHGYDRNAKNSMKNKWNERREIASKQITVVKIMRRLNIIVIVWHLWP